MLIHRGGAGLLKSQRVLPTTRRGKMTLRTSKLPPLPSWLCLDGGMGEELFKRGVPDDRKHWSSRALMDREHHDKVVAAHKAFILAGSDVITTCNFACTAKIHGNREKVQQLTGLAGQLARQAVDETSVERWQPVRVAGSLPPLSESYRADLILPHDEGVGQYCDIISALAPYVDLWICETSSGLAECQQAIDAIQKCAAGEKSPPLWISFALNEDGTLRSGERASFAIRQLNAQAGGIVQAVLFNCSSPEAITLALTDICQDPNRNQKKLLLGAYPNRLTPVPSGWTMETSSAPQPFRTDFGPARFVEYANMWRGSPFGVTILGGCCGIFPHDIACLRESLDVADGLTVDGGGGVGEVVTR